MRPIQIHFPGLDWLEGGGSPQRAQLLVEGKLLEHAEGVDCKEHGHEIEGPGELVNLVHRV